MVGTLRLGLGLSFLTLSIPASATISQNWCKYLGIQWCMRDAHESYRDSRALNTLNRSDVESFLPEELAEVVVHCERAREAFEEIRDEPDPDAQVAIQNRFGGAVPVKTAYLQCEQGLATPFRGLLRSLVLIPERNRSAAGMRGRDARLVRDCRGTHLHVMESENREELLSQIKRALTAVRSHSLEDLMSRGTRAGTMPTAIVCEMRSNRGGFSRPVLSQFRITRDSNGETQLAEDVSQVPIQYISRECISERQRALVVSRTSNQLRELRSHSLDPSLTEGFALSEFRDHELRSFQLQEEQQTCFRDYAQSRDYPPFSEVAEACKHIEVLIQALNAEEYLRTSPMSIEEIRRERLSNIEETLTVMHSRGIRDGIQELALKAYQSAINEEDNSSFLNEIVRRCSTGSTSCDCARYLQQAGTFLLYSAENIVDFSVLQSSLERARQEYPSCTARSLFSSPLPSTGNHRDAI